MSFVPATLLSNNTYYDYNICMWNKYKFKHDHYSIIFNRRLVAININYIHMYYSPSCWKITCISDREKAEKKKEILWQILLWCGLREMVYFGFYHALFICIGLFLQDFVIFILLITSWYLGIVYFVSSFEFRYHTFSCFLHLRFEEIMVIFFLFLLS